MSKYDPDTYCSRCNKKSEHCRCPDEPSLASAPCSETPVQALCHDCGRDYTTMPLDVVLPDEQWRVLCPEGGILCADCITTRAAKLPGVMVARMTLEGFQSQNSQISGGTSDAS